MSFIVTLMPVTVAESAFLDGVDPVYPGFDRAQILALASSRTYGGDANTPEHTQPNNEAGQLISEFLEGLGRLEREFSVPTYTLAAALSTFRIKRSTMQVRAMLSSNLAAYAQINYFDRCVCDAICAAAAGMYADIRITIDTIGE